MAMSTWKNVGGMFRMVLTGTDIKSQLATTIIDYKKLTMDNFFITNCSASVAIYLSNGSNYWGWNNFSTGVVIDSYNADTGILSYSNKSVSFTLPAPVQNPSTLGTVFASVVLCCDMASCAKGS